MKYTLIYLFLISFQSFATEQIPDKLIFKGNEYAWTGLSPAFKLFEEKGFEAPPEAVFSTGLYRKFIMTYMIKNDTLFLSNVEILVKSNEIDSFPLETGKYFTFSDTETKSVFAEYFPDRSMIPMINYSQILKVPYGEYFFYEVNGWSHVGYPNYLIFEVENGKVNKQMDLTFEELSATKERQFKKFKKSRKYKNAKREMITDLNNFNDFRPNAAKYTMDKYLKEIIFEIITELK